MLLQPLQDARVGLFLRQPLVVTGVCIHAPVRADDRQLGQAVVAADLIVHRIVARRHLERAGAEVALDALVRKHGDAAFNDGDDHLAADESAIAVVIRMNGDGDVRENRRGPRCRNRDVPVTVS